MALGLTPKEIVEKGEYQLLAKAEHWERVQLAEVAQVQNGCAFKSKYFDREDGIPLIRIRDISKADTEHRYRGDFDEEYLVQPGEILIGMDGDFLASRWKGAVALLNQRVCKLTVTFPKLFDERFFFLCLQPFLNAINAETSSVTVKHLSSKTLEMIPLPLPPLSEQQRIVAKIEELFSELDKGVESLKTAKERLKVYRQAALKHAFEGKLTAQWRHSHPDEIQLLETEQSEFEPLFPAPADLPTTWRWIPAAEALESPPSNGRSVKDRVGGFPVLRLTALHGGRIDLSEYKEGDWDRTEARPFLVSRNDFLLARGNGSKRLVGQGGLVPEVKTEVAYPDTIIRVRVDPSVMRPAFFAYLWNSRLLRDQIESSARTTAGIYKINQRHVNGFGLPLCSLAEQDAILESLDTLLPCLDATEFEVERRINSVLTLRQSILWKAFSGKLVEHNPADEPASALLERIRAEKEQQGEVKKKANKRKSRKDAA